MPRSEGSTFFHEKTRKHPCMNVVLLEGMFHIQLEISGDRELNVGITKEKFNELCSDLFDRAMSFIDYALSTARLSVEDINHVVI